MLFCITALKAVIRFADKAQAWIALAPAVAFMTFPRKPQLSLRARRPGVKMGRAARDVVFLWCG